MEVLFVLALLMIVVGVISAFMKGIYILLPVNIQDTIQKTSNAIDEVMKIGVLLLYPFVGGYIGNFWSFAGIVIGTIIGLIIGIGVRQSIVESQTTRKILRNPIGEKEMLATADNTEDEFWFDSLRLGQSMTKSMSPEIENIRTGISLQAMTPRTEEDHCSIDQKPDSYDSRWAQIIAAEIARLTTIRLSKSVSFAILKLIKREEMLRIYKNDRGNILKK